MTTEVNIDMIAEVNRLYRQLYNEFEEYKKESKTIFDNLLYTVDVQDKRITQLRELIINTKNNLRQQLETEEDTANRWIEEDL